MKSLNTPSNLLTQLGVEVASPKYEDVQVCNDNLVEDEYNYILLCSSYKVMRMKYDDLQDGHDNLHAILNCPPRRVSTYVHV